MSERVEMDGGRIVLHLGDALPEVVAHRKAALPGMIERAAKGPPLFPERRDDRPAMTKKLL
jgi:hypothetical protein